VTNNPSPDWKSTADEAKRNLILDAALSVFGARGFDEPSMDDIAAEADYTRRSLYRFFPSKEELGIALALRSCRSLSGSVGPLKSASLFDIAWAYWQFSRSHPEEFRVVVETRQLMMSGRTVALRDEWVATDEFGAAFAARCETDRESLAAAIGYVEFRFRNRAIWQDSGLAGTDDTVKTILKRILIEEKA
jgi:AcrR family transcriptional regulator